MGVSPSAWQEAVEVMGLQSAAIVLAAILQRADHIRSRGGYLRDLTARARQERFSVWPMVTALLNARMSALEKASGASGSVAGEASRPTDDPFPAPGSLEISSALRDSMKKKGW